MNFTNKITYLTFFSFVLVNAAKGMDNQPELELLNSNIDQQKAESALMAFSEMTKNTLKNGKETWDVVTNTTKKIIDPDGQKGINKSVKEKSKIASNDSSFISFSIQELKKYVKKVSKKMNDGWITVTSLSQEQALYYGCGAIAIVTICGVSYVFYKNGTWNKIGTVIKNNPRKAMSAALVSVLALGGSLYCYNS